MEKLREKFCGQNPEKENNELVLKLSIFKASGIEVDH